MLRPFWADRRHVRRPARALLAALAPVVLALSAGVPTGAIEDAELVDWYYAPLFGSGVYKVGDKRAALITVPVRFKLAEVGPRDWQLSFRMPLTIGLYDIEADPLDPLQFLDQFEERLGMASIVPGLDLEIPVGRWRLLPFANAGVGMEFETNEFAGIWAFGVSALRRQPWKALDLGFGVDLLHAAYATNGQSSRYSRVGVGFDVVADTGLQVFGRGLLLGGYGIYRNYFNDVDVLINPDRKTSLIHEGEVALTFGTDPPISVLGFEISRFGLGYRFGNALAGIRLVTAFPF